MSSGGCCGGKSKNQGTANKPAASGLNVKNGAGNEPFRQEYKPQGGTSSNMG